MIRVRWTDPAGEQEHEEDWDDLLAFLRWADREGLHGRYSAYVHDAEEDEWLVLEAGAF